MFVTLERDWVGRTVFLIGGGPSAGALDLKALKGRGFVVVAINDAAVHLPWADVAFSVDATWQRRRAALLAAFAGEALMAAPAGAPAFADERQVVRVNALGLSVDMGRVFTGGNSGYAALGMALMRGAGHVVLVGYDMTARGHWHGGYDWRSRFGHRQFAEWARAFDGLAAIARERGQRVFNANAASAIRAFPFTDFSSYVERPGGCETLRRLRARRS